MWLFAALFLAYGLVLLLEDGNLDAAYLRLRCGLMFSNRETRRWVRRPVIAAEIAVKLVIMNAFWIPIHFLWVAAGVTLRRLDLSRRAGDLVQ